MPSTAPALSTVASLKALKNFWDNFPEPLNRGLYCEKIVSEYFVAKNYILLAHRLPTQFAEVDLVFFSPKKELVLVEVKSHRHENAYILKRISSKQKTRLKNAHTYLTALYPYSRLHLGLVSHSDQVKVYEDVLASYSS